MGFVVKFSCVERVAAETTCENKLVTCRVSYLRWSQPSQKAMLRFATALMRFVTFIVSAAASQTTPQEMFYKKETWTASIDSTVTLFGTTEIQSNGVINN